MNPDQNPAALQVLVTGLARNCERTLARDVDRLRKATSIFKRVHFLVIESDSNDATGSKLEVLATTVPDFRFLSLGTLDRTFPKRTARIAYCRNRYIDELATATAYAEVSHIIVADFDGVASDITAEGIASCWRDDAPPWDVCTANQGDYYYDIWALRHAVWCPGDAWREHDALQPVFGETAAKEISILSRMVHIQPSAPMIEVRSAFGGLAVYRREALLEGRYSGLDEGGNEVCEHVHLHAQLCARGRRIFINPKMINARRTDHAARKKLFMILRRKWGGVFRSVFWRSSPTQYTAFSNPSRSLL